MLWEDVLKHFWPHAQNQVQSASRKRNRSSGVRFAIKNISLLEQCSNLHLSCSHSTMQVLISKTTSVIGDTLRNRKYKLLLPKVWSVVGVWLRNRFLDICHWCARCQNPLRLRVVAACGIRHRGDASQSKVYHCWSPRCDPSSGYGFAIVSLIFVMSTLF